MMATTAMRNATDTMMPTSVKKERSLWLQAASSAWVMASRKCMWGKTTRAWGGGDVVPSSHTPLPTPLFVSQRLNRIQSRGLVCRDDAEQDAGERGHEEGDDHRPQRNVSRHRRKQGEERGYHGAPDHAHDAADDREGRRLHEELPEDFPPRSPEGLADADLPGALGHRDHHDRHDAHAAHHEPDRREGEHDQTKHERDPVQLLEDLVLGNGGKVVISPGAEPTPDAHGLRDVFHRLRGGHARLGSDQKVHPALPMLDVLG